RGTIADSRKAAMNRLRSYAVAPLVASRGWQCIQCLSSVHQNLTGLDHTHDTPTPCRPVRFGDAMISTFVSMAVVAPYAPPHTRLFKQFPISFASTGSETGRRDRAAGARPGNRPSAGRAGAARARSVCAA